MNTAKTERNLLVVVLVILLGLSTGGRAFAAQVFTTDLIVQGSSCVGIDCISSESFGFDTLRLKENNLRIKFQDTSASASFPTNDWQLTANDSSNGGANKFSIDDIDGGKTPFTIEANARTNSLYVDDGGRIGLGTSTPVVCLHCKEGNTPTLRLEQDGSSGFTPQTWDVAGNEANFFIRDVTNGSKLPFRIKPGATDNAIYIDSDSEIGIGTSSPAGILHIENTGGNDEDDVIVEHEAGVNPVPVSMGIGTTDPSGTEAFSRFTVESDDALANHITVINTGVGQAGMVLNRTGGVASRWYNYIQIGNTELRWFNGSDLMRLDTSGNLFVTAVNPSSRELKRDIKQLDSHAALSALEELEPVEYYYKADADNEHRLGFVAEDVPDLVSTKSRKAVDSMEVLAVVTKVVKGQQATIEQQRGVMDEQKKMMDEQKKVISDLTERLSKLEQMLETEK